MHPAFGKEVRAGGAFSGAAHNQRKEDNMANIRRHESQQASGSLDPYRAFFADPMRAMRELVGPDLFGTIVGPAAAGDTPFAPDIEIRETKDAFVLQADLPGVKQEDLEIDLAGNR